MNKKNVVRSLFFLSGAMSLSLFAVDAAPAPAAEVTEKPAPGLFVMADRGYSIQFPQDWLRDKVMEGLDVFAYAPLKASEKPAFANASVISGKLGEGLNLDAFYSANIEKLPAVLKDYRKENEGEGGIPGLSSKWIIYSYKLGDVDVKVLQYFVVTKDYGSVITFSATPDEFVTYRGVFDNIASTFKQISPKAEVKADVKAEAKTDAKDDAKAEVKEDQKTEK